MNEDKNKELLNAIAYHVNGVRLNAEDIKHKIGRVILVIKFGVWVVIILGIASLFLLYKILEKLNT